MSEWISVKDRLPDVCSVVLVAVEVPRQVTISMFFDPHWDIVNTVTHWMPLPEPPQCT